MSGATSADVLLLDAGPVAGLAEGEPVVVEHERVGPVLVVRVGAEVLAVQDRCTHQRARLSQGFVEGCLVECPLHASAFDLRTGVPTGPPARRPLQTFEVRVVDGQALVAVPAPQEPAVPAPQEPAQAGEGPRAFSPT